MKDPLTHKTLSQSGKYTGLSIAGLEDEVLLSLYRQMLRLRLTEQALHDEYHPADEMRCPVHFCMGQEAVPSALSQVIKDEDFLFSHHRSHGYYFAKGAPMQELFAELYGKATGASGGLAGSQEISHPDKKFFSGAILAGATSIATGTAFGLQLKNEGNICVAACGEGATNEGVFWEAINHAALKKLPILYIIENNRYATFADQLEYQADDNLLEKINTFGVNGEKIFGNDVTLAYKTIQEAADNVRAGNGPYFIEAYTQRTNSHVGPEDDSANEYRSEDEVKFWKENCPIILLEDALLQSKKLNESLKEQYISEIQSEIDENFKFAKESPFPENNADWESLNYDTASPAADKYLIEIEKGSFDPEQSETKLGPY